MRNDYSRGLYYALQGVKDFYRNKFLWKYTIVPLSILLILHIAVWTGAFVWLAPYLEENIAKYLPRWLLDLIPLNTTVTVLTCFCAVMLLAVLSNCIYETVGAFFFPAMVRAYEEQVLKITLPELSYRSTIQNCLAGCALSCQIIVLLLLLSTLALLVPIAGMLFFLLIMGYQYSMLFMSEACFSRDCRLSDMKHLFSGKTGVMHGFGMFVFFMVQIPFASALLYPGFVLGATRMFNEENDDF